MPESKTVAATALLEHPARRSLQVLDTPQDSATENIDRSILLFDPQALVRQTLRTALEARTGFRIVAEARDATEAVAAADRYMKEVLHVLPR